MKLTLAAIATALFAFGASSVKAASGPSDTTILNYALTLEHLENAFYHGALKKFSPKAFARAGYPSYVYSRVQELAYDEATHVAFLTGALGADATKACKYSFPYQTVDEFLALSRILEGVGVSAYLGAAKDISLPAYLTAAGAILTVEARHQAVISEEQGHLGFPSPFDTPLSYSQVYSLAAPFFVPGSCPSTNPPLPVTDFPSLTVGKPCKDTKLTFTCHSGNKTLYAHFLNGLTDTVVKINPNHTVAFPKNLSGTVYVLVSTSSETLDDQNTVAGPAIVQLD